MVDQKKRILLVVFALFLASLTFDTAFAEDRTSVEVKLDKNLIKENETFLAQVYVNLASGSKVLGAELKRIIFPQDKLEVLKVSKGDLFKDVGGFYDFDKGKIKNGSVSDIYGLGSEATETSGSFIDVKFRAEDEGTVEISLEDAELSDGELPDPPPYSEEKGAVVKITGEEGEKNQTLDLKGLSVFNSSHKEPENFKIGDKLVIEATVVSSLPLDQEILVRVTRPSGFNYIKSMKKISTSFDERVYNSYQANFTLPEGASSGGWKTSVYPSSNKSQNMTSSFEVGEVQKEVKRKPGVLESFMNFIRNLRKFFKF